MRLAITNGEDASRAFADGLTPLCRMAALGERRILKILLAAKADVNSRPGRSADGGGAKLSAVADQVVEAGFAALHWACREGRTECARLLLEAEATADVRSTDDATPFMLAAKGAWLPSASNHHRPPPSTEHHHPPLMSSLHIAPPGGHFECAALLVARGARVDAANARGGTAMVVACVMGEHETVRQLLALRADPDAVTVAIDDSEQPFQCRPLVTACRYDRPACVKLLLGMGVGEL